MRVHHLSCGTMCPFGGSLLGGTGGILSEAELVCHCLLIESKDGLVLVDSGIGLGDMGPRSRLGSLFVTFARPKLDPAFTARRQIEAMGFTAEDVRHVVLTHLDLDHAGGIGDFPNAAIHVSAREHAAAMRPATRNEKSRYVQAQWAHGPRWVTHEVEGERWMGLGAVRAIEGSEEEILIVPVEGHTRGHAAIAVRTPSGWLLHAGDAYFHRDEMRAEPSCPPGLRFFQSRLAVDDAKRRANQTRLRELVRHHGGEVTVFSAHDPVELRDLQTRAAGPGKGDERVAASA